MKNLLLFICLIFIADIFALPASGYCDFTNPRLSFQGKGLQTGPKIFQDDYLGEVFLEFDYLCKPFNSYDRGWKIGTYHLGETGSRYNALYLTDTNGVIFKTLMPTSTIQGQANNIWLEDIEYSRLASDGYIYGSYRFNVFQAYKNGNNSYTPGTYRTISLNRISYFRLVFSNGSLERRMSTNFPDNIRVYVYDASCGINYPSSIDVGELSAGQVIKQPFAINISCKDAVTIEKNVMTKFTLASQSGVSVSSDKSRLQYRGESGLKVDMQIENSNSTKVIYGEAISTNISDASKASYNIGYIGLFEALSDSNQGDFSFTVNFEITYN